MVTTAKLITAKEFAALPDAGTDDELIRGEVTRMPPPGMRHARLLLNVSRLLAAAIDDAGLGKVAPESGVRIARDPDTVLAPDVAIYLGERVRAIEESEGYAESPPDLVCEIVSPSDYASLVHDKVMTYLAAGVRRVLVLDPRTRTLTAFEPGGSARYFTEGETWEAPDLIPGFRMTIADLFR